jgi:deoxyadenosine/deoxycytidine kinase
MKFRSIAVEGPIGVGKTSFVDRLSRKFDANQVLEDIENPFLQQFYEDKQGAAFQAQLFFLLSRYRQLQELNQRDLFRQITLLDYMFPKDKIFAYLNLDDSELLIYDKLYSLLEEQVPKPDGSAGATGTTNARSPKPTSTRSTRPTITSSSTTTRRRFWSSTRPRSTS